MEAAEIAKSQGKVRYVGFTGHKSPHIFEGMLAADYEWDSCQMPVSVFDHQYRSFIAEILPELNRRGIACIGMKSLGGNGQFITECGLTAQELRRYAPLAADHVPGLRRGQPRRRVAGPRYRPFVRADAGGRAAGAARSGAAPGQGRPPRVVQDVHLLRLAISRRRARLRQSPEDSPACRDGPRLPGGCRDPGSWPRRRDQPDWIPAPCLRRPLKKDVGAVREPPLRHASKRPQVCPGLDSGFRRNDRRDTQRSPCAGTGSAGMTEDYALVSMCESERARLANSMRQ